MIEINQRGERDWAVYVDGEYKGTVSRIGIKQFKFVCTHSHLRYQTRDEAISFLVARVGDELSQEQLADLMQNL